jgi:hypothetical protein
MIINRQIPERRAREHGRFFADRPAGGLRFKVAAQATVIAARFHTAYEFAVPIGYQDQTGFHYGAAPLPA